MKTLSWQHSEATRVGFILCLILLAILLGFALSVDLPKSTRGFRSDSATYYSLAHSLATDYDFYFDHSDLVRVWEEYPTGPEGIFLKRGKTVNFDFDSTFPFVHWITRDDPQTDRLYYGKAYIYPLVAAPFVWLFGTNGFLVLHVIMLVLGVAAAYAFLVARAPPAAAASYALVFFFASMVPVYIVSLTPDLFNLSIALYGLFLWSYKKVAPSVSHTGTLAGHFNRFLRSRGSDYLAVILLGVVTFSKPIYITLILPILLHSARQRHWFQGLFLGAIFVATVGGLFVVNGVVTGELNYQGGDRKTFYSGTGGYPFQTYEATFDTTGRRRATDTVPLGILVNRDALLEVFPRNLVYFSLGRHSGLVPYFFPGVLSLLMFLGAGSRRQSWQWLIGATLTVSVIALLLYMPFTYSGGGGPVGNRYFMGYYPLLLFLTPQLGSSISSLVAATVGGLFTAQLVLNPFSATAQPEDHPKSGPYRLLPVELSLVNDLPVNLTRWRTRQPLLGNPPLLAYFLDDNSYSVEQGGFWLRGRSRSEIIVRARTRQRADGSQESLRIRQLNVEISTGEIGNRVTVETGAEKLEVQLGRYRSQVISVKVPKGFPYRPGVAPTNYVYLVSVSCISGFPEKGSFPMPSFNSNGRGNRFLGALIKITPIYES